MNQDQTTTKDLFLNYWERHQDAPFVREGDSNVFSRAINGETLQIYFETDPRPCVPGDMLIIYTTDLYAYEALIEYTDRDPVLFTLKEVLEEKECRREVKSVVQRLCGLVQKELVKI